MKHLSTLLLTFFLVTMQDTGRKHLFHLSEVKKMKQAVRCGSGTLIIFNDGNSDCANESIEQIYNQVK